MKVLVCHNFYQRPGGEDRVFADETALLRERGHHVISYERTNADLEHLSSIAALRDTLWSPRTSSEIEAIVQSERPDVVHCHNTFPLISPSVYYAARREGAAVVQTLHNYRLLCANAQLLRGETICEKCVGKPVGWPGVVHRCYRESALASAAVVASQTFHRAIGTWNSRVDRFIALTEFSKEKFVAGGLPSERIVVKPNFVNKDPGIGSGEGGYAVFVGRLSPEKGIDVLLDAWSKLSLECELRILGDGPLVDRVREAAATDKRITYLGQQSTEEVNAQVGEAAFLVVPSIWYEPFGLSIVEAFARGTPVIASRLGAPAELVRDGANGFLCLPGRANDLAATIIKALQQPGRLKDMRKAARDEYEERYNAQANYEQLSAVYRSAIEQSRSDKA